MADGHVLMKSVSGIRGVIGEGLVPGVIERYVMSFVNLQKAKLGDVSRNWTLILGRDSRVSGPWVRDVVVGILVAAGVHVTDIGVVATPTVQLYAEQKKATLGGLVVTSSHNPIEWNGLKFIEPSGLFLGPSDCERMYARVDSVPVGTFPSFADYVHFDRLGSVTLDDQANRFHVDTICRLPYIDAAAVATRKFRVCLDSVNGAGGPIMSELLTRFGCEIIGLNLEPNGHFAHPPEPIGDNLNQLCEAVKKHGADFGIAVDPDVDRCVLIDERGEQLGEEYTLVLAVEFLLGRCGRRGPVCKNLSSSKAVDEIAARYGCEVFAAAVGEINVAEKMLATKAIIGGEGNGGVMLPDIHIGRDAPVAAALTLQHLYLAATSLSELKKTTPQFEIVKLKAPLNGANPDQILHNLKSDWSGRATIDEQDGLHISTADWWIHLRKSNTEPIIRVIGEDRGGLESSTARCKQFLQLIVNALA